MLDPIQAQVLAIINNLVVGIIRLNDFENLPSARRSFCAHTEEALSLLISAPP